MGSLWNGKNGVDCTFLCGFDLQVLSNMIDLVLHVWPLQVGIWYVYEESRTATLDQYGSPIRIHSDCNFTQKEKLLMIIHVSTCLNDLEESEKPVVTGNWT